MSQNQQQNSSSPTTINRLNAAPTPQLAPFVQVLMLMMMMAVFHIHKYYRRN
jgi:hypothetical protein